MKIERELGSYGRWIIHEYLSFQVNSTTTPDNIRDGKTDLVTSVTRTSTGLFQVTLRTDRPTMVRHICARAGLMAPTTTAPTQAVDNVMVVDNWDPVAGTFSVLCVHDASAVDPDDETRIWVHLTGSVSSVGTDPADA